MSDMTRKVYISTELSRNVEKVQIDLVNSKRLAPLLELHGLGFDLSPALEHAFARGFHDLSKALLDAGVTVTYHAEYNAATRGVEAFALLCSYIRPGPGALTSAVERSDVDQVERITSRGTRVHSGHYGAVACRPNAAVLDNHQELLRLLVTNTDDRELTIDALRVIARHAKPVVLIQALKRSLVVDRSSLITHALCVGAEGNVVALRADGLRVRADQVQRFGMDSLHLMLTSSVPLVMTRLLELYRADNEESLPAAAAESAVHSLVGTAWLQLIHCRHIDDAPTVEQVRKGLTALAACIYREHRHVLTRYVDSWIDGFNKQVTPGVRGTERQTLIRVCEECFGAADQLATVLIESPCP
jgi:hypothetical protein